MARGFLTWGFVASGVAGWAAPALAAGTGPDVEVLAPARPIVISGSQPTASVAVRNNGPGTSAAKMEVNFDVRGLDRSVVQVVVGTNPCPRTITGLYGPCPFTPGPDHSATDVGFTVFTLAPVPGRSGPAGSLIVSVRFGPDSNPGNNSVTIPVEVTAPPASPTPTPPTPTPPASPTPTPPTPTPPASPTPTPPASPTPPGSFTPPPSASALPSSVPTGGPAGGPVAGSGGGLPTTGAQSATVGAVGLGVLLLGVILVVATRRRRSR